MFDDNGGIGVQLFTIAGHVFADDGDGTFNGNPNPDNPLRVGDFPLAGVTVYEDRNGNSHHDDGEPNTVTDDFGLYQLRVSRVDRMSVIRPAGWVRSSPLSMGFGTVDIPMRQSSEIHGQSNPPNRTAVTFITPSPSNPAMPPLGQ